jgi:hypothetical protein
MAQMLRDRTVLAVIAAAMLFVGVVALYWPTSLDHYDRWGFRVHCGSGFVADYGQATIADQADAAAKDPTTASPYVEQCHAAIWWRRGWAYPLTIAGLALSVALLLGFRQRAPAEAEPHGE